MGESRRNCWPKVNWLAIPVRVFSIGSGEFLLVLAAMLLYQKLNALQ